MRRRIALVIAMLLSAFAMSCGFDVGLGPAPDHGTYFRVEPRTAEIAESRSVEFAVRTDCKVDSLVFRIHWLTNPIGVNSIVYSNTGLRATASCPEAGTVYAVAQHGIFGERRDSARVTVRAVTPRSVEIGDTIRVAVGQWSPWVSAMVLDSVGVGLYRPHWQWHWSVSVGGILGFSVPEGNRVMLYGDAPGQALIVATAEGFTDTAVVIVQ